MIKLVASDLDGTIIDKTSDYDESHFIKKITVRVFLAILLSEPYLFYPMMIGVALIVSIWFNYPRKYVGKWNLPMESYFIVYN